MTTDTIEQTAQIIEALIFASPEPVSTRNLEKHLPENVELEPIMDIIRGRYGEESGIELRRIGTAWGFRTKAEISSLLMIEKVSMRTLSRAALETLAIIAYHQPVTRGEIEEIRGVSISSGTIDILLEQDWIKPRGRRQTPGRPLTWGTTQAFLDHFGLDDVTSLPGLEELKQSGLLRVGTSLSDKGGLGKLLDTDAVRENENEDGDADSETDGGEMETGQFPDFDSINEMPDADNDETENADDNTDENDNREQ